jgi:exodeoxyribonuclease V alpha subunit
MIEKTRDVEAAYATLERHKDSTVKLLSSRYGRNRAPEQLRVLLETKQLRLLDTDEGQRIINDRDYTLNEMILSAARSRGAVTMPPIPENIIRQTIESAAFQVTPEQEKAIRNALTNRLSIIIGGPGTGKSAILKLICQILNHKAHQPTCLVAAFSARIAVKTADRCGTEGYTLHALTGTIPNSEQTFGQPINQTLAAVIIDEAFSVSPQMLSRLLAQVGWDTRLILVGDPGQMMPIEGGRTLHDLAQAGIVATTRLTLSHRLSGSEPNSERSHLELQSDRLLDGFVPHSGPGLKIHTAHDDSGGQLKARTAVRLFQGSVANGHTCVILTATRFGACGHIAINKLIVGNSMPSAGHELITTSRHPDNLWKNGEKCVVVAADEKMMELKFEDSKRVFCPRRHPGLAFGYAMSGHRGQGLEYDRVILILDRFGANLHSRQYVRSAITRAPSCIILTDPGLLERAAKRDDLNMRTPILKNIASRQNQN